MESETSDLKIVQVVSLGDINRPSTSKKPPTEDKPLLKLIKHLVNFAGNEEKTILTNSQLMNILHKEFDIDVWGLPTLAIEIYINVLKKFLKLWPRWDTVDTIVQRSKLDSSINIESILDNEYVSLKVYLKEMLDLSKEQIDATLKKIHLTGTTSKETKVALDVHCSRQQLHKLFFRFPDPAQNMTIFNNQLDTSNKIQVGSLCLGQICYWPGVTIEVDAARVFQYTRRNLFDMKHTLVNHRLGHPPEPPATSIYVHSKPKNKANLRSEVSIDTIVNFLNHLMDLIDTTDSENADAMKFILKLIMNDVLHCPNPVDRNSEYLYYLNQQPYVRHLFKDNLPPGGVPDSVAEELKKYDLELVEYISPNISFTINTCLKIRADGTMSGMAEDGFIKSLLEDREQWIRFRCTFCDLVFNGLTSLTNLRSHFSDVHLDEPSASCAGCDQTFSLPELATNKWKHTC